MQLKMIAITLMEISLGSNSSSSLRTSLQFVAEELGLNEEESVCVSVWVDTDVSRVT
jgi:hypothetical protein